MGKLPSTLEIASGRALSTTFYLQFCGAGSYCPKATSLSLHCGLQYLTPPLLLADSCQQPLNKHQKVALFLHSGSNVFHERADMSKSRSTSGFFVCREVEYSNLCSVTLIPGGSLHLYDTRCLQRVEEGNCAESGKRSHPVKMMEDNYK